MPSGTDQYVYKVVDGKATRVQVKTGLRRGSQVEVVSGLQAGDVVVTAGQIKLREGAAVRTGPSPGAPAVAGPDQAAKPGS